MKLSITCWEDDASQRRREEQADAPGPDDWVWVPCCRCGYPEMAQKREESVVCNECLREEVGL